MGAIPEVLNLKSEGGYLGIKSLVEAVVVG